MLHIIYLPDDVDCDQAHDKLQELQMTSKFESDLWNTVNSGRKWLVIFNARKTQLVSFDRIL